MATNETSEVLSIIAKAQEKCAPVQVMIGCLTKDNQVIHGGVYIKDCPSSVIEALIEEGYLLSMDEGYLHPLYKRNTR